MREERGVERERRDASRVVIHEIRDESRFRSRRRRRRDAPPALLVFPREHRRDDGQPRAASARMASSVAETMVARRKQSGTTTLPITSHPLVRLELARDQIRRRRCRRARSPARVVLRVNGVPERRDAGEQEKCERELRAQRVAREEKCRRGARKGEDHRSMRGEPACAADGMPSAGDDIDSPRQLR